MIIEIYEHLIGTKQCPDRNYFISLHDTAFYFFSNNKINWKGQILI